MTDIPIIFSAAMVRALLDGQKTMTRRLAWRIKMNPGGVIYDAAGSQMDVIEAHEEKTPSPWQRVKPGDRLWVRENLCAMANWGLWHDATPAPKQGQFLDDLNERGSAILERYAPSEATDSALVPSIFLPRWASRLTLVVTATKIERVQDISADDAWNEGVERRSRSVRQFWLYGATAQERTEIYKRACPWEFEQLWKSLHGPDAWDANPEVVALTFTVHQSNIDALEKAA